MTLEGEKFILMDLSNLLYEALTSAAGLKHEFRLLIVPPELVPGLQLDLVATASQQLLKHVVANVVTVKKVLSARDRKSQVCHMYVCAW